MSFPGSSNLSKKNEKLFFYGFMVGGTKRKRNDRCRGPTWMGYCPFPAPGRDTAGGVTTGVVWRRIAGASQGAHNMA